MPDAVWNNFVDTNAIDVYARRVASKIPLPAPRERFARVSFDILHDDPRNARPLEALELADAPDWALRDHLLGRAVHAFEPHPESVAPLKYVARALKDTCAELDHFASLPRRALSPRDRVIRQLAKEFVAKISRMSYQAIAEKAGYFRAERLRRLQRLRIDEVLFAREEIFTAPGRCWRRIVSVGELAALGRELSNCLAESSRQHAGFARRLRADRARFWVLRDHSGAGLMAVMTDPVTGRILEARGPRNAHVRHNDSDIAVLIQARGLAPLLAPAEEQDDDAGDGRAGQLFPAAAPRSWPQGVLRPNQP